MMKVARRVFGLAVAWALIYALPAVPIEGLANLGIEFPFTYSVDMWPQELGIPGFIGGLFFGVLMATTGRLHDFESLSTGRLTAWGAAAGVLLGGFYSLMAGPESLRNAGIIFGIAISLGALAGPGSALVFRFIARRRGAAAQARAGDA